MAEFQSQRLLFSFNKHRLCGLCVGHPAAISHQIPILFISRHVTQQWNPPQNRLHGNVRLTVRIGQCDLGHPNGCHQNQGSFLLAINTTADLWTPNVAPRQTKENMDGQQQVRYGKDWPLSFLPPGHPD